MPTVQEMLQQADGLTRTQRRIFDAMLENPEAVCYDTLRDISRRIGVAEVSVLNMCRRLGCSGYVELKNSFRAYISQRLSSAYDRAYTLESGDGDEGRSPAAELVEREEGRLAALAASLDQEEIDRCAGALMDAREVLLYGHDVSKVLADYFAHRLNYLRIKARAFPLGDSGTVQTTLAMCDSRDVVVLFSFPPYYMPVTNVSRYAAYRGARVIVVTDSPDSPAIPGSTCRFICDTKTKFFFNTLTAPFSLIHVLTASIAIRMGPALNRILEEELSASRFMNGGCEEESEENYADIDS